MWKQFISILLLLALANSACKLQGCNTCTNSFTGGLYVETCEACNTGFILSSGACTFDIGLVTGVSLGAIIIVVIQISCFCFCRAYFQQQHKRKIQFTLEDIFEQLEEERRDPDIRNQLLNLYELFHN